MSSLQEHIARHERAEGGIPTEVLEEELRIEGFFEADGNEVETPEAAKALPSGQWVEDADGKAWCLIDTHMGFPQRMAAHKRYLANLDTLAYPLHLADFDGDCEHRWGHHELGQCIRCGQAIAEPRPMFFDDGGAVFRAAAEHNARIDNLNGERP